MTLQPRPSAGLFARDATLTLLFAFIVMESISVFLLLPTQTSYIQYVVNFVVSCSIITFSLLGLYGLAAKKSTWIFFALLASVWETVFHSLLLVSIFQQATLVRAAQELSPMVIGVASIACALRAIGSAREQSLRSLDFSVSTQKTSSEGCAVEVNDVYKKYFFDPVVVPAVNGLTLKVKRGEFVAIMGPSGCGKSTLLNLIGALDKPTSGKVLIDGVDVSTLDQGALANLRNEKIGFIFQSFNLVNRSTVYRNIEMPILVRRLSGGERERRVKEMLEVVGLADKASRKPRLLSGGEQQRVAIARALINRPSIILADEPTGNLDSKSGKNIVDFMRKLNKETGTTIIVVTHDPTVANTTNRIVYLKDGRIINEETRRVSQNEA